MLLRDLVDRLDAFFRVRSSPADPAFSRHLPRVYDAIGYDWRSDFEPDFADRCNGLLLRGAPDVGGIFAAAFPSEAVLGTFLREARPGDCLFLHHPIDLRCGDPQGDWGEGFVAIPPATLGRLRDASLSVYSCHAPLDVHPDVGTASAMVEALAGRPCGHFFPYGDGHAGILCDIAPLSSRELVEKALRVFGVPYADVAGPEIPSIARVAVVGGGGDSIAAMRECVAAGAGAYLTGEIRARIEGKYGREKFAEVTSFAAAAPLTLIGVSHAASEHLVMRTQFSRWCRAEFGSEVRLIPEPRWWR